MRYFLTILFALPFVLRADQPAPLRVVSKTVRGYFFDAYIFPVGPEDRLAIRESYPRQLAEFSLLSKDGYQGAKIENIKWSRDAQFLVFSTAGTAGRSPWNFRTYVFSSRRNEFLSIDDVLAPVTASAFSFPDATHLSIETTKTASASADDTIQRTIDLDALPWKQAKTEQDTTTAP